MNLNELAQTVTSREGLKKSVNIAQVKEVIRVIGDIFAELSLYQFLKLAFKIRRGGQ